MLDKKYHYVKIVTDILINKKRGEWYVLSSISSVMGRNRFNDSFWNHACRRIRFSLSSDGGRMWFLWTCPQIAQKNNQIIFSLKHPKKMGCSFFILSANDASSFEQCEDGVMLFLMPALPRHFPFLLIFPPLGSPRDPLFLRLLLRLFYQSEQLNRPK